MNTPATNVQQLDDLDESRDPEGEMLGRGHQQKESSVRFRDCVLHTV